MVAALERTSRALSTADILLLPVDLFLPFECFLVLPLRLLLLLLLQPPEVTRAPWERIAGFIFS